MGFLSWFMANPRQVHWDVLKRAFKYLFSIFEYSLCIYGYHTRHENSIYIHG